MLPCEEPALPAVPAARALWRGAPCLPAAELQGRHRGAAGARAGGAGQGNCGAGSGTAGGCGAGSGTAGGCWAGGCGVGPAEGARALPGGAAHLRVGDPGNQRFQTGLVPFDLQPWAREVVAEEGLPPPLAVFIYVANKRRGGANAW